MWKKPSDKTIFIMQSIQNEHSLMNCIMNWYKPISFESIGLFRILIPAFLSDYVDSL